VSVDRSDEVENSEVQHNKADPWTLGRSLRHRISTARLLLRCWNVEDAPALKAAIDSNLDHLRPWVPWAMNEPSELEAIRQRLIGYAHAFDAGRDFVFAIFDKNDTELLGGTGLHPRIGDGALEIGYGLRRDVTGRGYVTEAVDALMRAAFDEVGAARIEIRCDPANTASAAVPPRLGFRHRETILENPTAAGGQPHNLMIWELTAEERARPKRLITRFRSNAQQSSQRPVDPEPTMEYRSRSVMAAESRAAHLRSLCPPTSPSAPFASIRSLRCARSRNWFVIAQQFGFVVAAPYATRRTHEQLPQAVFDIPLVQRVRLVGSRSPRQVPRSPHGLPFDPVQQRRARHECVNHVAAKRVGCTPQCVQRDRTVTLVPLESSDGGLFHSHAPRQLKSRHTQCVPYRADPTLFGSPE
jgi:RimJ/RimL family protein N-acetyltransferase